jgi:biotin synthase-like enzyme
LDYDTLKELRDNGLRLLLVEFESGNQQILDNIQKGVKIEVARKFMKHCKDLSIKVHGTFIIGLPVETKETIEDTVKFAQELSPHTIQVLSPRLTPALHSMSKRRQTAGLRTIRWWQILASKLRRCGIPTYRVRILKMRWSRCIAGFISGLRRSCRL